MTKLVHVSRESARQNFGISFSVIGVTGGVAFLFTLGMVSIRGELAVDPFSDGSQISGGPAVMVWGWVIVGRAVCLTLQGH